MRLLLLIGLLACRVLHAAPLPSVPDHAQPCVNGFAETFPCSNVDLLAHIGNAELGSSAGNDIWGWTDPDSGREYALMGLANGTAFVDITDPEFPQRLGRLPTHSSNSSWRDIKTRGYYAFIVSEASDHGMQIFDLRRLRAASGPGTLFNADAHYAGFGRAHNIVIDTDSGFAFAVGSRQGAQTCASGLHMIDIRNPLLPAFAGCFSADGYTHDAQCLSYPGPDPDYLGREICLASNEDTITIVDVSSKANPVQISRTTYAGRGYTHQGWLSEDAHYFLVDDETDEINFGHNTRTYIFDVSDLDAPRLHATYTAPVAASDHNLYVKGRYAYQSNYRAGLRILDLAAIDAGTLTEVGYFDTHPESDAAGTSGAWSVYPFFASGTVILSDISAGLFVLRPLLCDGPADVTGLLASAVGDQQIALSWDAGSPGTRYQVHRAMGACGTAETLIADQLDSPNWLDSGISGGIDYGYRVRAVSTDGRCQSEFSACRIAQTTGICTAPPAFSGPVSASSPATTQCAIQLAWPAATARCAGPVDYRIERSLGATFDPSQATLLANGLSGTAFTDLGVEYGSQYSYRLQAFDQSNGSAEIHPSVLSFSPVGPLADGDFVSGAELGDALLDATGGNRHLAWEVVSDLAHSGERSYFSSYPNSSCLALISPSLELSAGETSQLSFFTRYSIEAGWDAGLVQISSDGGSSWQTLEPIGGYPAAMNNQNSADACNFPDGQPAFTGSNLAWQPYTFDLGAYTGTIRLRWLFSTNNVTNAAGWWIDDVVLSHVQTPGICLGAAFVFGDGFE